jgi:SAM-dependent methyltransferase
MTYQRKIWEGDFGKAYTDRNVIDWRTRLPAFRKMLDGLLVEQVCEVGCNRGHNLIALAELIGEPSNIIGVEPNQHALEIARASSVKIGCLYGHAMRSLSLITLMKIYCGNAIF